MEAGDGDSPARQRHLRGAASAVQASTGCPALSEVLARSLACTDASGEALPSCWPVRERLHVLTVGDGDLSFSLALSRAFGAQLHLTSSSLLTHNELFSRYASANECATELLGRGSTLRCQVDGTALHRLHPQLPAQDLIIFNYPHLGTSDLLDEAAHARRHQVLILHFFHAAKHILAPRGRIQLTLSGSQQATWDLGSCAARMGLLLLSSIPPATADSFCRELPLGVRPCNAEPGWAARRKYRNGSLGSTHWLARYGYEHRRCEGDADMNVANSRVLTFAVARCVSADIAGSAYHLLPPSGDASLSASGPVPSSAGFRCDVCDEVFSSAEALSEHAKAPALPDDDEGCRCEENGRIFASEYALETFRRQRLRDAPKTRTAHAQVRSDGPADSGGGVKGGDAAGVGDRLNCAKSMELAHAVELCPAQRSSDSLTEQTVAPANAVRGCSDSIVDTRGGANLDLEGEQGPAMPAAPASSCLLRPAKGRVEAVSVVSATCEGARLRRWARQHGFPLLLPTKSSCDAALRDGRLRVNGDVAESARVLCRGDVVELLETARAPNTAHWARGGRSVPQGHEPYAHASEDNTAATTAACVRGNAVAGAVGIAASVRVLHSTPHVAVAWKPVGMRASGSFEGTLQDALTPALGIRSLPRDAHTPAQQNGANAQQRRAAPAQAEQDATQQKEWFEARRAEYQADLREHEQPLEMAATQRALNSGRRSMADDTHEQHEDTRASSEEGDGQGVSKLYEAADALTVRARPPPRLNAQELMISRVEIGCAGLCVIARSLAAYEQLSRLSTSGRLVHVFVALVHGVVPSSWPSGVSLALPAAPERDAAYATQPCARPLGAFNGGGGHADEGGDETSDGVCLRKAAAASLADGDGEDDGDGNDDGEGNADGHADRVGDVCPMPTVLISQGSDATLSPPLRETAAHALTNDAVVGGASPGAHGSAYVTSVCVANEGALQLSTVRMSCGERRGRLSGALCYALRKAGHPVVGDRFCQGELAQLPRSCAMLKKKLQIECVEVRADELSPPLQPLRVEGEVPERLLASHWEQRHVSMAGNKSCRPVDG